MTRALTALLLVSALIAIGCGATRDVPTAGGGEGTADAGVPPDNAQSAFNCSVRQGFNFEKDAQVLLGHVNYLKIADKELDADFNVTDPEDVSKLVKVFGILSNISWAGGYADPVVFTAQVSTNNKNVLATLVHKSMSNTEIVVRFTVYDFDPKEKKYFKAFFADDNLNGLIAKSGGELHMHMSMDASPEVVSPKNYAFTLGVMPQDQNMEIQMAVSATDKFTKKWGVEVAK